jgi:predicted DNA binding protein
MGPRGVSVDDIAKALGCSKERAELVLREAEEARADLANLDRDM